MKNKTISKIITVAFLIVLALVTKVDALTLTTKFGSEYVNVTVEKDEIVNMKFTSKEGFRFKRWVIEEGSLDDIDTTQEEINFPMPDSNVVIRGEYDTTYRITFNRNDNGEGSGEMADMIIPAGGSEDLILNIFQRPGYNFKGWSVEQDDTVEYEDGVSCTPTSDLTLYAVWETAEVTVQFVANGGSAVSDITVMYGKPYGELPVSTKTGYTLEGWYMESELTNKVTNETEVMLSIIHTLYAKWTANTYTVKYDGNGSTSGSMSDSTFRYDTVSNLTANGFSRTGYTFAGWATTNTGAKTYEDGQSVKNLTEEQNGSVTLYAVWFGWTSSILSAGDYILLNCGPESFTITTKSGTTEAISVKNTIWRVQTAADGVIEVTPNSSLGDVYLTKHDGWWYAKYSMRADISQGLLDTGIFSSYTNQCASDYVYRANFEFWCLACFSSDSTQSFPYIWKWWNGTNHTRYTTNKNTLYSNVKGVSVWMTLNNLLITGGTGASGSPYIIETV